MDRSEGERRAAKRPKDQPESEGSRASRSRRSVTGEKRGAHGNRHTEGRPRGPRKAARLCGERRKNGAQRMPDVRPAEQSGVSSDDEARRRKERFALRHTCPITFYR